VNELPTRKGVANMQNHAATLLKKEPVINEKSSNYLCPYCLAPAVIADVIKHSDSGYSFYRFQCGLELTNGIITKPGCPFI